MILRRHPRLTLRRLSPDDLSAFQAYRTEPELGRYQSWEVMDDDRARTFLAAVATAPLFEDGEWSQIGIAQEDRLIGDIGLCPRGDDVEFGITLATTAQGKGLGLIALCEVMALVWAETDARRIIGIADAENVASTRLMERAGMNLIVREDTVFRGEPCMEITYAASRP
ncbi:GNAT family N-acetyltransferase [Jannaschia sp. S6380]|uniref:GNAT family N-acetyltransferase n=1 Tax=Jannaschia sp. S6380 TaxID=2926408 RepID=UPI001FF40123|nr:GNAT family N-acetyltransferase [Jannaschia sp. S6380]MCK0169122.1 GNAT family N-acetyltransferase [Jannaschia sp. S6380]